MHPYTVKNYLWAAIIIMLIVIAMLSGCSSAPTVQAQKPPYCYTNQTILTKNGEKVESVTLVECTDDQIKRLFEVRTGIAPVCGEFQYHTMLGGVNVTRPGVSCQKPDGSWEIVNTGRY